MSLPRRTVTSTIINGTAVFTSNQASQKGPQASVYRPEFDKGSKVFKGGVRQGDNDYTCKSRNTRIFITALGGLNVTVPSAIASAARILQAVTPATPNYTLSMTVQSEYWSAGIISKTVKLAFVAMAALLLAF